ncbi:MAG: hypothetical protein WC708_14515 [Lentisphaeria bacterium]
MKKLLAVCAFLALCGAAMAYDVATSFKGTVDVKFNWVNFSEDDKDYDNCNDWENYAVKYDAYLVLCYDRVICPVCPFNIEEATLWLVDKKTKRVFVSSLYDGGISEASGFCFGDGNVGVMLKTYMPYLTYFVEGEGYGETSPEVTFVLSGGREKLNKKNPYAPTNILTLNGGIAFEDLEPREYVVSDTSLECDDGSMAIFADVSFKKQNIKVTADPYCIECTADCDELIYATNEKVMKASKKFFWWEVLAEDDLEFLF